MQTASRSPPLPSRTACASWIPHTRAMSRRNPLGSRRTRPSPSGSGGAGAGAAEGGPPGPTSSVISTLCSSPRPALGGSGRAGGRVGWGMAGRTGLEDPSDPAAQAAPSDPSSTPSPSLPPSPPASPPAPPPASPPASPPALLCLPQPKRRRSIAARSAGPLPAATSSAPAARSGGRLNPIISQLANWEMTAGRSHRPKCPCSLRTHSTLCRLCCCSRCCSRCCSICCSRSCSRCCSRCCSRPLSI